MKFPVTSVARKEAAPRRLASELIVDVTGQQADGRRVERRLVLENNPKPGQRETGRRKRIVDDDDS